MEWCQNSTTLACESGKKEKEKEDYSPPPRGKSFLSIHAKTSILCKSIKSNSGSSLFAITAIASSISSYALSY